MKILGDRIAIKVKKNDSVTASGIVIPTEQTPFEGEVIAVGTGRVLETGETVPLELSVGDNVIFEKHTGTLVKIEGEDCLILYESNILAVL